jgi:hypothetical protein
MNTTQAIEQLRTVHTTNRFQFEFNCSMVLAGDSNRKLRQSIVKEITGEVWPVTKCGFHKVADLLKAHFEQLQLF